MPEDIPRRIVGEPRQLTEGTARNLVTHGAHRGR